MEVTVYKSVASTHIGIHETPTNKRKETHANAITIAQPHNTLRIGHGKSQHNVSVKSPSHTKIGRDKRNANGKCVGLMRVR